MNLWRIHLRPASQDDADPVAVCLQQKVIGIGWPVPKKPRDLADCRRLLKLEYKKDNGWHKMINAIGEKMAVGDLVWARDFDGIYYLGKISGGWEYRDRPENLKADIVNVRPCKLVEVGTSVAGKIINCFIPPSTVQQIRDDTAKRFSTFVYNRLSKKNADKLPLSKMSSVNIFRLLSAVDLEDVVGLYLQHEKGLLLIPSSRSRKNDTIFYEYELKDPRSGRSAYVQVKSGVERLDPSGYYGRYKDHTFYLFSPEGYLSKSTEKRVVCLQRRSVESFLESNRKWLPLHISIWLDMRDKLSR